MSDAGTLIEKIGSRDAKVGIIGLGYVGLPLMIRFAEVGFKVLGFDIDEAKNISIRAGKSFIKHFSGDLVARVSEKLDATSDYARVGEVDVVILCLPTPLNVHREPDLSYITNTMTSIAPYLVKGQALSLESTTYPGTTEEELLPRLVDLGFNMGSDFFLIYSPEREDPGNRDYSTQTIPKVCGGITPDCLEVGVALYESIIDRVVPVSSTKAAELTKILENIHRAVNIGLVNEMKIVADKMGIDIREVIDAAATKPFGFVPYYPGPGLGGHCIPIDPFYLTWKAREFGVNTRFIELAGEVNSAMPAWVVAKVADGLNKNQKAVNGSRILVLGIAYKKNVDDMRESPAVEIMSQLKDLGAHVDYSDPHIPFFPPMRRYHFDQSSVDITPEVIASYDSVLVATDHDDFDYDMILLSAKMIVDSRGVFKQSSPKVIRA
jgi:UDP-N-acetyl-D-glucosamine dehydrogenase